MMHLQAPQQRRHIYPELPVARRVHVTVVGGGHVPTPAAFSPRLQPGCPRPLWLPGSPWTPVLDVLAGGPSVPC